MSARNWRNRLIALGYVIGLGGCAAGAPAPLSNAVPATPSISFDGSYQGSIQVTSTSSASAMQRNWCETDSHVVLQVTNNTFSYALPHPNLPRDVPTSVYSTSIAPDGSFQAVSDQQTTMTGKVIGTHMTAVINGLGCVYSLIADRV